MRVSRLIQAASLAVCCAMPGLEAEAADRTHAKLTQDGGGEEPWYFTLGYCAGRMQVLAEWASSAKRPEATALEKGMNILFTLSVGRLMEDRGLAQDKAVAASLDAVKQGIAWQQQSDLVYLAAQKMDEEFGRQVGKCDQYLKAYDAEFPGKISTQ